MPLRWEHSKTVPRQMTEATMTSLPKPKVKGLFRFGTPDLPPSFISFRRTEDIQHWVRANIPQEIRARRGQDVDGVAAEILEHFGTVCHPRLLVDTFFGVGPI